MGQILLICSVISPIWVSSFLNSTKASFADFVATAPCVEGSINPCCSSTRREYLTRWSGMPVSVESFIIPIGPLSITFLSTITCLFNNSSSCWTLPVSINTCSELYLEVYLAWHEFALHPDKHPWSNERRCEAQRSIFNAIEKYKVRG